jgi:uncharacterized protein YeaO (DUF488 family)
MAKPNIDVKRVYDPPATADGTRILVDRLWPRGISKDKAAIDHWMKEVAPSNELRHWYGHDPEKWAEFRRRYAAELKQHPAALDELKTLVTKGRVTLLFSSRETAKNNAVALKALLEKGR